MGKKEVEQKNGTTGMGGVLGKKEKKGKKKVKKKGEKWAKKTKKFERIPPWACPQSASHKSALTFNKDIKKKKS